MTVERRHVQTYTDLFIHRRDLYAQQTPKGSYFLKREPVTADIVQSHLEGRITAGWYALSPESTTSWVVLDADRRDGLDQLREASKQLDTRGIPSLLELSRRGGHLWILFEPISARVARRLILGALPDLQGVEVFPKRDRLDDGSRVGNLVRGPLGVHLLTGEQYPFVDPVSLRPLSESAGGTLERFATTERISASRAAEGLAGLLEEAKQAPSSATGAEPGVPADGDGERVTFGEIKERIGDLYAFVSQFVELDEAGRGHCPFHPPDVHPSFAVDRRRGFWVCFHEVNPRTGRYLGGDAVEFYRRFKNLTYRDVVTELAATWVG